MKNEPVIAYNHLEEDESIQKIYAIHKDQHESLPASLYMILVTDVVLMAVIAFVFCIFVF